MPRKNIEKLAGKPLIVWTIEAALSTNQLDCVVVSTDDEDIALIARNAGADVPFIRPKRLAEDDSSHIAVVEHAFRWLEDNAGYVPNGVMLLQPTSPLRTVTDIEACIALATETQADAVVSVSQPRDHPYKMYTTGKDGRLSEFVSSDLSYRRRQDLPPLVVENGAIYLNCLEMLLRDRSFVPPGALPYLMPPERSVDIDSRLDFDYAEWLLKSAAHA
jgi:CMP-N,N'-diacetyllegionaminic acid synthase